MASSNIQNAINQMKVKIRGTLGSSNIDNVLKLSRAAENTGLDEDSEVEVDFNIRALSLSTTADADGVDKLGRSIRKLAVKQTDSGVGISSTDDIPEGVSNKYFTEQRVRELVQVDGEIQFDPQTGTFTANNQPDAMLVYETSSELPLTGNSAGDQALVRENSRLYIYTGTGWYSIPTI